MILSYIISWRKYRKIADNSRFLGIERDFKHPKALKASLGGSEIPSYARVREAWLET